MYHAKAFYALILLTLFIVLSKAEAAGEDTSLEVWANEAIVATYTYDYKNFLAQQKGIAKYFTAEGWTKYSAALNTSNLPDTVQKNNYFVSAVALLPPKVTIQQLADKSNSPSWKAVMPLLVLYKNPQYQQKQTLEITLTFTKAPAGQGVRGFAITSLQSEPTTSPCVCKK